MMADSDDENDGRQHISLRKASDAHGQQQQQQQQQPFPVREFVPARADVSELGALADLEKLSVMSYNVLSQMGAHRLQRSDSGYVDSALLSVMLRRERLLREMLSYDADVLCLQEVDDYDDYWSIQLTSYGYDSIFAIHANETHDHGLVIAFKRELFQLFRTQEIDLNEVIPAISDVNLAAKCQQNCIALCVQLQPWEQSRLPSAICVVTTHLAAGGHSDVMDHVRVLQTEFLCREIAQINVMSHVPILLAGTFNALPSSDVYHVIRTGRRRPRPQPPAEIQRPDAVDATPTSVQLTWQLASSTGEGDAPILGYKIAVKNCTSATLGFSMHEIEFDGDRELQDHAVTMLSAGITYQFRIAARNQYGYGAFSQPSLPVTTPQSSKLQAKDVDDVGDRDADLQLPLYVVDDIPPQVKPYDPSFGSGRTPRFANGALHHEVSPRKLLLQSDPKQRQFSTLWPRADFDRALVHGEQFESAYAQFQGFLSEPELTFASDKMVGTIDYIFYSAAQFEPFQLLEIPTLDELQSLGVDTRQSVLRKDAEWAKHKPTDWKGAIGVTKNDDLTYMGEWVTPELPNSFMRSTPWLPNRVYPSDHVALACVLAVKKDNLAVEWN